MYSVSSTRFPTQAIRPSHVRVRAVVANRLQPCCRHLHQLRVELLTCSGARAPALQANRQSKSKTASKTSAKAVAPHPVSPQQHVWLDLQQAPLAPAGAEVDCKGPPAVSAIRTELAGHRGEAAADNDCTARAPSERVEVGVVGKVAPGEWAPRLSTILARHAVCGKNAERERASERARR